MYYDQNGVFQAPDGHATSWVDLGGGIGSYVFEGDIGPMGSNLPKWMPDDPRMGNSATNTDSHTGDLVGAMSNQDLYSDMSDSSSMVWDQPMFDSPTSMGQEQMSGAGFETNFDDPYGTSIYEYWSPQSPESRGPGPGGQGFPMTAATYNPLSGFENVLEAESILPWLYAEDEEDDRRINRDYIKKLFGEQAPPSNKLLPSVNVFGGYSRPNFLAGQTPDSPVWFNETTGGGGAWYDPSFYPGTQLPSSDMWSQVPGFTQ